PAYQVPEDRVRSAVRAFISVFPSSVLLSGHVHELIMFGAASDAAPPKLEPEPFFARLAGRPKVAADLERIGLGTPLEVAGLFVGGIRAMRAATERSSPVEDD